MGVSKRLIGAGATASGGITPSENFKVITYTGTGASRSITGVGFKPDLLWIKRRSSSASHSLTDSNRGNNLVLQANETSAEASGQITLDSDGFTIGNDNALRNTNGETYVAWCWKANEGTTSSNSDGSITTTVQNNADAGFSIITYTGNGTVGATIGHGLGYVPDWFAVKKRSSGTTNWRVYHKSVDTGGNPQNFNVELNGNGVLDDRTEWNDTMPTSSVISLNAHDSVNASGSEYVCYAWTDIDAFSKFSYYTGTGSSTDTPIIETGFEPAWVMIKVVNGNTGNWNIYDNARNTTNPRKEYLIANGNNASNESSSDNVDFLSNGFQLGPTTDASLNVSGNRYIYMAFAADPDTEAPTLASSFNIETYKGTGAARSVTGFGFSPGLIWGKNRDATEAHWLYDTLRGPNELLESNSTIASTTVSNRLTGFESDGFTIGGNDGSINGSGVDYVAWTWKADDNEPTLRGGNAKAVYKFEDNYNDVTGTYNGSGTSGTSFISGGKFNKAVAFSGTSSNMDTGITARNFESWSFWFKPGSSNTGYRVIVCTNTSGDVGQNLEYNSSNSLYIADILGGATNTNASVTIDLRDGDWHHIVITKTATQVKVYVDKVRKLLINNATGSSLQKGNEWSFGKGNYGDANSDFNIDQARYYEGVLEQEDIDKLYNETAADNNDLSFGAPKETITSVNANAGFSIVKYEGDGFTTTRIPHGLSSKPDMVIVKDITEAGGYNIAHVGLASNEGIGLQSSAAAFTSMGNNGGITYGNLNATTFGFASGAIGVDSVNKNGNEYIAYCFHNVTGYQKFGSYTGNGSATGPSVTTGFKPDFLMVKKANSSGNWRVVDSRRGVSSSSGKALFPNLNNAEYTGSSEAVEFTSTGFQIKNNDTSWNGNSDTFIYWAIAKNVPSNTTLIDSFSVKTYTGDGASSKSITGLGFQPDFVWLKSRSSGSITHTLFDTLRGPGNEILSSANSAESYGSNRLTSFDSDGFSLGDSGGQNQNGATFVAWAWKAGNQWQSNVDGGINSLVNANTANGFSIVKYTATGTTATVGHGLSSAPEFIMAKVTNQAYDWLVYHASIGNDKAVSLHSTAAAATNSFMNDTTPTSTVFTAKSGNNLNYADGNEIIAYCFHSVSGFSKIGSYTGNGSSNRSITGLGFQPSFVLLKNSDSGSTYWAIFDSVRGGALGLFPNDSQAESNETGVFVSLDSDGFTVNANNTANQSGHTIIYAAFRMNPTPVVAAGKFTFLVVAGGGAGGGSYGGGGGAGGLRTSFGSSSGGGASVLSEETLSNGTYTITVGAGGSGVSSSNAGNDGSTSSITGNSSISTTAGGGGGCAGGDNGYNTSTLPGRNGGSGGGGGVLAQTSPYTSAGGTGTTGEGFAGGTGGLGSFNGTTGAGGGGGASEAGDNGKTSGYRLGGNGGDGLVVDINNDSAAYAGGGGAGSEGATNATPGTGGGGTGGYTSASAPTNGTANTGGGGGGVGNTSSVTSGAGGSGVVILRMRTSDYSGTTTGSPTVTVLGDETILKYTGSGTYVHS